MAYKRRVIDTLLDDLLPQLPAILLDGPKAVGKTTTAVQRAKTIKRFDRPEDRLLADANPHWALQGERPVLLDEWQRSPNVWDTVKAAVDSDFAGGQYLFTGSMPNTETHSGAGRITSIRMRPMSFAERDVAEPTVSLAKLLDGTEYLQGETNVGLDLYCQEMMQSGFPALRTLKGNAHRTALDGYLERVIDADIKEMGLSIRKPASLRAWMTAYAAATGTTASWETIRDAANTGSGEQPAKTTVIPFRDALTRLRFLDELEPWTPSRNQFARASQSSKHYLADPALALRLLNFDSQTIQTASQSGGAVYDSPLLGRMFEALAVQSIQTYAQACYAKAMHFRDSNGRHEVDMILEKEDGRVLAIEIKLTSAVEPKDVKQLKWLQSELGDQLIDAVVIYSGRFAYRANGIAYVPLAMLGP